MRPKICVPIVEMFRNTIVTRAREYVVLPIDMVEWRVDFYSGYASFTAAVASSNTSTSSRLCGMHASFPILHPTSFAI